MVDSLAIHPLVTLTLLVPRFEEKKTVTSLAMANIKQAMSEISCNRNPASFAYLSFFIETPRQCNVWFADMTGPSNVLSKYDRIKLHSSIL